MRARGITRFAAAAQATLLLASLLLPAIAAAATIQTDLWVYQDGDTVTVTGMDFGPVEVVDIVTTDPVGAVVDAGSALSDESGSIQYQFVLHTTMPGIYDVRGSGQTSGLVAVASFDPAPTTDAAVYPLRLASGTVTVTTPNRGSGSHVLWRRPLGGTFANVGGWSGSGAGTIPVSMGPASAVTYELLTSDSTTTPTACGNADDTCGHFGVWGPNQASFAPGDLLTVHGGGAAASQTTSGGGQKPVTLTLKNPANAAVVSITLATNANGEYDWTGRTFLASDLVGTWTVTVSAGATYDSNGTSWTSSTTITLLSDTTAPTVSIDNVSDTLLNAAETSTNLTWHASENGTFGVRVGGADCATGTLVASGTYSTSPASVVTNVLASSLSEGANTLRVCVTDGATNAGLASTSVTKDTVAPSVSVTPDRPADVAGWYNHAVTFDTDGTDATSGIASCDPDQLYGGPDGTGLAVSGSCTDNAGNVGNGVSADFDFDDTDPSASLAVSAGTLGENGWYIDDVTVSTSGSDDASGVASCTADQLQTTDTAGMTFAGSCTDVAGNVGTAATLIVRRDATAPSVSVTPDRPADVAGWYNHAVTFDTDGTDATSGIASCDPDQLYGGPDGTGLAVSGSCTDNAGNVGNGVSADFDFDDTDPVTTFGGRVPVANGFGWANAAVVLTWTCADATSGPVATPVIQTVSTDGLGQSSTGTCLDVAGNSSSDTQVAISIDRVDPVITFDGQTPPANGAGWNNTAVTLDWSCSDALSGEVDATLQTILSGEGAGQSATATCFDKADNTASDTQAHINIDLTDPVITFLSRTPANGDGWNNGPVTVAWTCSDALSGVVSAIVSDTVSTDGEDQTAEATCTDLAGNSASASLDGISIDTVAPHAVVGSPDRGPDHNGWYNSSLTVDFSGADDRSGIAACDLDVPYAGPDSATASVGGSCTDHAGNTASATFTFAYDATAPSVVTRPAGDTCTVPGNAGWCRGTQTAGFTASDGTSGVAAPPCDSTGGPTCNFGINTASNGAAVTISSGTVADVAGNTAAAINSAPFKIDSGSPSLAWSGSIANGASFVFGSVPPAPTCSPSDALSGPFDCVVTGYSAAVGSHTLTATAHDLAGNSYGESRSYTVTAWTLRGFYSPVDMNDTVNVVKGGSTVPLKFEAFAGSTELVSTTAIKGFRATAVSCDAFLDLTVDGIEITSSGGTSLRYDGTSGQFIQNWQTPKSAGACYVVTMTAQDGTSLNANFKLK